MTVQDLIAKRLIEINIQRDTQFVSLCRLKAVAPLFDSLLAKWRETHEDAPLDIDLASNYIGNSINFYLGRKDSMNGYAVQSIFDHLENSGAKQSGKSNVQEHKVWLVYYVYDKQCFTVRLYYGQSEYCKVVETGEMIPKTKIECD